MISFKTIFNVFRYRIGLRSTLPAKYVNSKKIYESNEPLVNIINDNTFDFYDEPKLRGGLWVRTGVYEKLKIAATILPAGYKILLYVGWRNKAYQWLKWEECGHNIAFTANPSGKNGVAPHQTGGAMDLSLVFNGAECDMGTEILAFDRQKSPIKNKFITDTQKQNRKILYGAMRSAGFVNYPNEWWHYSYGDRAWAAYGKHSNAIYGETFTPDYKLKPEEMKYKDL
ncbi:MAG: hypothetical protein LBL75_00500 [Rickettsiales bacterium]|jgi:D-alanyl-D-alanine dipeptidase|nr:hypothetical protein [Rickettsiales bacterium]